eukprot:366261-Chlamydomonas_euryale.AAC.7
MHVHLASALGMHVHLASARGMHVHLASALGMHVHRHPTRTRRAGRSCRGAAGRDRCCEQGGADVALAWANQHTMQLLSLQLACPGGLCAAPGSVPRPQHSLPEVDVYAGRLRHDGEGVGERPAAPRNVRVGRRVRQAVLRQAVSIEMQ